MGHKAGPIFFVTETNHAWVAQETGWTREEIKAEYERCKQAEVVCTMTRVSKESWEVEVVYDVKRGYNGYTTTSETYCTLCGALIYDTFAHTKWHQAVGK